MSTPTTSTTPVACYPDHETGTEMRVWALLDGRFSVTVYDVDAQETAAYIPIFNTLDDAIAYAEG